MIWCRTVQAMAYQLSSTIRQVSVLKFKCIIWCLWHGDIPFFDHLTHWKEFRYVWTYYLCLVPLPESNSIATAGNAVMDVVNRDFERTTKKARTAFQSVNERVDNTILVIEQARDALKGMSSSQFLLLSNVMYRSLCQQSRSSHAAAHRIEKVCPVWNKWITEIVTVSNSSRAEHAPARIADRKEFYKHLNHFGKTVDKHLKPLHGNLYECKPSFDPELLNEVIARHLFRSGDFEVAELFVRVSGVPKRLVVNGLIFRKESQCSLTDEDKQPFIKMFRILEAMSNNDLSCAIEYEWQCLGVIWKLFFLLYCYFCCCVSVVFLLLLKGRK